MKKKEQVEAEAATLGGVATEAWGCGLRPESNDYIQAESLDVFPKRLSRRGQRFERWWQPNEDVRF